MKNKILSLQSLKFICFLSIFFWHIKDLYSFHIYKLVGISVEFFIVSSGFLMMYNYHDRIPSSPKLRYSLDFIRNKILKILPLFIITTFIKLPISLYKYYIEFGGFNISFFINSFLRLLSSLLFVQAFIPFSSYFYAFNGVSWFLDVIFFCYFFTPFIISHVRKMDVHKSNFLLNCLIIIKLLFCIFVSLFLSKFEVWITYINPFYRIFDYIEGVLVCNFFLNVKNRKISNEKIVFSIFEIIIIIIISMSMLFDITNYKILQEAISLLLVFVFSFEKGLVSHFLKNRFFLLGGAISMELFLIHQPVISYFKFIFARFSNSVIGCLLTIIILFFVIIISFFYYKNEISILFFIRKVFGRIYEKKN